jgi:hypothetical protein
VTQPDYRLPASPFAKEKPAARVLLIIAIRFGATLRATFTPGPPPSSLFFLIFSEPKALLETTAFFNSLLEAIPKPEFWHSEC